MARRDTEDPTVTSSTSTADEYPEGTHPIAPLSEQAYSPERLVYKDNPDKPDPTSVAQIEVRPEEQ